MQRGLALALAALAAAALWAGSKKGKTGARFGPARLITLNMSAENEHGSPVDDLTEADVRVFDQGRPQTIVRFLHNTDKPGANGSAPLGPHEFSNRTGGIPPRVTLILFDLFNTRGKLTDQGYARGQIIETLRKLDSADYVYLYLMTMEGLLPIEPLPEPGEDAAPRPAVPWTRSIQEKLDTAITRVFHMKAYVYTDDRVIETFQNFESLAARLGAVAGRKNIVWITNGVPIATGWGDYTQVLWQLSATLDQAGVSMYPVDLSSPGMTSQPAAGEASADTIEQMAGLTGGRAYLNADIPGAIRQALEDARSSYRIAYYPPPGSLDGKMHKVALKCSRKGVRLMAETGYLANPPEASEGPREQAALLATVQSPFDASEIGLWATAAPDAKDPARAHLDLRIRAQDVMLLRAGDRFQGELELSYALYEPDGQPRVTQPEPLSIDMTGPERDEALKNGIRKQGDLVLDNGVKKVRVVVYDHYSNEVGSLTLTGIGKPGG